jgi:hypothetical protein
MIYLEIVAGAISLEYPSTYDMNRCSLFYQRKILIFGHKLLSGMFLSTVADKEGIITGW